MRRSVVGQLAAEPAANLEAYRAAHEAAHEDAPPAAQLDALSQCEPHIGSVLLAEYHRGSFELALLRSEKKNRHRRTPTALLGARCATHPTATLGAHAGRRRATRRPRRCTRAMCVLPSSAKARKRKKRDDEGIICKKGPICNWLN